MPKMRARVYRKKDKIFFDYSMGKVNSQTTRVVVGRVGHSVEQARQRNEIMQEIDNVAWKLKIRSKESQRINWHYARRNKETIPQLEKLLTDMRIEYVYQQAGGIEE